MIYSDVRIRPETESDYSRITEVNDSAFGQKDEGRLVAMLRETEEFIADLSLVAEMNGLIVGHILFFPVTIRSKPERYHTLSLAPMSVLPEYQNQKIGSRLVEEGLRLARERGFDSVVVVGHPNYYPKFGFEPASKWKIKVPFKVPDEAFMGLELVPEALKGKGGIVEYPRAFEEM